MRLWMPIFGLFLLGFAAACLYLFKNGLDQYLTDRSISSVVIAEAEGWDRQPYKQSDGEAITGARFTGAPAAQSTTERILAAYDRAAAGEQDGIAWTFRRDDEVVALRAYIAPFVEVRLSMAERLGYTVEKPPEPTPEEYIGSIDGIAFLEMPRTSYREGVEIPDPVNYRYFKGMIGDTSISPAVDFSILTNASDAAVAEVLATLDMAGYNSKLDDPVDGVLAGEGFRTDRPEPLSTRPPRPTVAFSAMRMLADGGAVTEKDTEILSRIRNFELANWDQLLDDYDSINDVSFGVLQLLAGGDPADTARYYASVLANSEREWNNYEFWALSIIAKPGSAQADLGDYQESSFEIAPEIVALITRLPEESTRSEEDEEKARGRNCRTVGSIQQCD